MDHTLYETDFNGITEIFLSVYLSYDYSFIDVCLLEDLETSG